MEELKIAFRNTHVTFEDIRDILENAQYSTTELQTENVKLSDECNLKDKQIKALNETNQELTDALKVSVEKTDGALETVKELQEENEKLKSLLKQQNTFYANRNIKIDVLDLNTMLKAFENRDIKIYDFDNTEYYINKFEYDQKEYKLFFKTEEEY